MKQLFCITLCWVLSSSVLAIDVIEFDTAEDRKRYQDLTYELRCPKCQNQNLIDSDSQISEDLRREVARLIKEGKTDKEIKTHMVSLYGDFILYRPPVQNNTIVLWVAPAVMLGVGLLIFMIIVIRRSKTADLEDDLESAEDQDTSSQDSHPNTETASATGEKTGDA